MLKLAQKICFFCLYILTIVFKKFLQFPFFKVCAEPEPQPHYPSHPSHYPYGPYGHLYGGFGPHPRWRREAEAEPEAKPEAESWAPAGPPPAVPYGYAAPEPICHIVSKSVCHKVPVKVPKKVPVPHCDKVPQVHCRQVLRPVHDEVCQDVPVPHCHKVAHEVSSMPRTTWNLNLKGRIMFQCTINFLISVALRIWDETTTFCRFVIFIYSFYFKRFLWKRQDNTVFQCHMNVVPTIRKKFPEKFVFPEFPNNMVAGDENEY